MDGVDIGVDEVAIVAIMEMGFGFLNVIIQKQEFLLQRTFFAFEEIKERLIDFLFAFLDKESLAFGDLALVFGKGEFLLWRESLEFFLFRENVGGVD